MTVQLSGVSAYLGDVHGSRLGHLEQAMRAIDVQPSALLCAMDLDQVLSLQDLLELEQRYVSAGRLVAMVPGNHEAAIIFRIIIDSSTYRSSRQNTDIQSLIEAINLPDFIGLREYLLHKLEIVGGVHFALGEDGSMPGLLIHGALAGKEEKYIDEFPPDLQSHIRTRPDLWLRLETGEHVAANFAAMREQGVELMVRGHDHYAALRTEGEGGGIQSHQLVINVIEGESVDYGAEKPREKDDSNDIVFVDSQRLNDARAARNLYWHELEPGRRCVINFGPYYQGYFGLLRAGEGAAAPAAAFCRTKVSFYTEADRERRLKPVSLSRQAQSGKSFYELFPGRPRSR